MQESDHLASIHRGQLRAIVLPSNMVASGLDQRREVCPEAPNKVVRAR
jgi:hypothetical protein